VTLLACVLDAQSPLRRWVAPHPRRGSSTLQTNTCSGAEIVPSNKSLQLLGLSEQSGQYQVFVRDFVHIVGCCKGACACEPGRH